MRKPAPWTDRDGNPVREGDRLVRATGETGIVFLVQDAPDDESRWQVNYGGGACRLCIELGKEVNATVIDETGMTF